MGKLAYLCIIECYTIETLSKKSTIVYYSFGMPMPIPSKQKQNQPHMFYLVDHPCIKDKRLAENYLQRGETKYLRQKPKALFEAIPMVDPKWVSSRKERRKHRFSNQTSEFIRVSQW
jgi:hypothetical protein